MRSSNALLTVSITSLAVLVPLAATALVACSSTTTPAPTPGTGIGTTGDCKTTASLAPGAAAVPLEQRAYVVSRDSGNVTVIDLQKLEVMGNFETCGEGDHMGELNADFTKLYVDSPGTHESIVVDTRTLEVKTRIVVGAEDTHISLSKDGKLLAIVNEYDDTISFLDPVKDVVVKTLGGFYTPHFVRWAPDGKFAYVANLNAHHITKLDVASLSIVDQIVLEGFQGAPNPTPAPDESGFADAQIDKDGVLYAAHAKTGRVLVYDTVKQQKVGELTVGAQPWIVYAEHPFLNITHHMVPNFGDQTVAMIAHDPLALAATITGADHQSFGVNYSSLAPERAYVMNRQKNEIAIVNTSSGVTIGTVPVGGTTETASTTADGKYIVAAVSSANRVVVIDAVSGTIVKTFDGIGNYPWSVTIPMGQNYCH